MPIDKQYAYHMPSDEGLKRIIALRDGFTAIHQLVDHMCLNSREKSIALTELETAAMWAIKAIVFNYSKSIVKDE
jgi:hypothetical protein